MENSRSELDRFKSEINLIEYASDKGYQVDRAESSRNSVVLRQPTTDDKLIVARGQNGHWKYFSVRDPGDNGTIIDFIKQRENTSLGEIRQELRPWIGENPKQSPIKNFNSNIEASRFSRSSVQQAYDKTSSVIWNSRYLLNRGISRDTLTDRRFIGQVHQDNKGNFVFPHRDREGLSGFELKNQGFTGFSRFGRKSIWHSNVRRTDNKLVFTESAIDGLSYHQIKGDEDTRYMSTGGQISPHQERLIKAAIDKMPPGSKIVSAFDRDKDGDKFHEKIKSLSPNVNIIRDTPNIGKDWNEQLQAMIKTQSKCLGFNPAHSRGAELTR